MADAMRRAASRSGHLERRCVRPPLVVELEPLFQRVLDAVADGAGVPVSQLVRYAESSRRPGQPLASAVRVLCLEAALCTGPWPELITRPLGAETKEAA